MADRLTEKRNSQNAIPLKNAVCGLDMPYWALCHQDSVTDRYLAGDAADRLAAYEDTGLTPEEVAHTKDLLAAEKDGRLVTLPVGKIGDIVEWDSGVCKELFLIRGIVIYVDGTRYDLGEFMPVVTDDHICRIIPRDEAEAALKESNSTTLKSEAEKELGKEAQS